MPFKAVILNKILVEIQILLAKGLVIATSLIIIMCSVGSRSKRGIQLLSGKAKMGSDVRFDMFYTFGFEIFDNSACLSLLRGL